MPSRLKTRGRVDRAGIQPIHVEQAEVVALVCAKGSEVKLCVGRVVVIGDDDGLGQVPVNHVGALGATDGAAVALHIGTARVLAWLGVGRIRCADRIPHKAGRPGQQWRSRWASDDGVLRAGRPSDAVGRIVEVPYSSARDPSPFEIVDPVGRFRVVNIRCFFDLAHAGGIAVAVAHQPLETPGRVLVVRVAEDVFDRVRRREEVVGARSGKLHQAERGLLPMDAVLRRGQTQDAYYPRLAEA